MWGDQGVVPFRKDFLDMLKKVALGKVYLLIWYIMYIHLLLFRFDASPKKIFVIYHCHNLFVCLVAMVFKLNNVNIQS